jgi:putative addiction module killer protein
MEYTIKIYRTETGERPFSKWLHDLSDRKIKSIILVRLERLKMGNFGIAEPVGGGVYELKFYIGPGYRVYFAKVGFDIVLMCCAGDKKTQPKDINKAKKYYVDYQRRTAEGSYD